MPGLDEILSLLPSPDSSAYRVLLVDDDESILQTLRLVLESNGYEVVAASTVSEALSFIARQSFDVQVTDLHMPKRDDGLTVVSAMCHSNPKAVTLIFSAFPEMQWLPRRSSGRRTTSSSNPWAWTTSSRRSASG